MKLKVKKSSGFTLAEVLITLGLIGVVAAITLPALIQNNKNKEVEARLKKIYSIMNQAILMSEKDNGPKEYWSFCDFGEDTNTENTSSCRQHFDKYILPYIKYTKTEEFTAAGRYNLAIYFSDGSVLIGKMHPSLVDYYFYPNGKNFKKDEFMTVSDDGTETRKMCGTTFFAFEFSPILNDKNSKFHYRKGFEPYKRALNELTVEELTGSNVNACTKNANYKVWCTALIQLNGWKIPNDYPFKVK